ncbi:hypothetical protein PVA19_15280 [Agrobacterium sp. CNPSo 3708]|uniref:hypothetical protein n=1 Tax=Agrobacterium sp. CNPSo 3708 TaxID=3028150 RepID=UPI0023636879|nr:hypothetical protein [Agrobacterium sp. CNPSo 3708]MDD1499783.1 hypothetical protein [Agrobacterium sp. CNPSo 3708]
MSEAIRLYVVTDNQEEACLALLGCGLSGLPAWMKMVSDPHEVEKLPSGTSAMGLFFPKGTGRNSYLETVWAERRERGGIDYDFGKHQEKLNDWIRRRDEAERRLLADALAQEPENQRGAA